MHRERINLVSHLCRMSNVILVVDIFRCKWEARRPQGPGALGHLARFHAVLRTLTAPSMSTSMVSLVPFGSDLDPLRSRPSNPKTARPRPRPWHPRNASSPRNACINGCMIEMHAQSGLTTHKKSLEVKCSGVERCGRSEAKRREGDMCTERELI